MARGAVIVGASGDIGSAIAQRLLAVGRPLFLTRSREGTADDRLRHDPERGICWANLDLTDPQAIESTMREAIAYLGTPLDAVFSAGIVRDAPLMLTADDVWDAVLTVNLTAAFRCIRALAREMTVSGGGNIVLVGSTGGRTGTPGQSAYAASKGGLEAFARVAAVELGRFGVTVNVVAPGPTESRMFQEVGLKLAERAVQATPLRQLTKPDDIAEVVENLLSPERGYLTGQTIVIDGGMSIAR